ncbi:hypothetical protein B7R54_18135 [Subtercola boreus]|uniref:Alkaline shock response membrane anchor protein AmaP n=1 Tax=Subtercola boreus TaxID=120213 RepID=A0A3E0VLT2_9MICO|nr:hypothetical protein [Subtercola boreus]RFA10912.1 hypothetical protein B7R54_18135 [Subtercola boreus]TQL55497.1 hypothetical protein FB464_3063 [Subtercola boreus]
MSTTSLYRRLNRRETHSPLSGLAIVLAVIAILVLAYLGVESVLRVLGAAPLLAAPATLAQGVTDAPSYPSWTLIAGGIVVALVGLVFVITAFSGARRARHTLTSERSATVIDNEVIASALARHAARAANISPDNTSVTVTHRTAVVHVTPASGSSVDKAAVASAVDEQLAAYALKPGIRSRIVISSNGKVGA